MMNQAKTGVREKSRRARRTQANPGISEEERILRKAQEYLLFQAKCPSLWTVAGIREETCETGSRRWVIAVHLRYPTGFEGYLGDLLYDGSTITEQTDRELMQQRARVIEADPEGIRQWHARL